MSLLTRAKTVTGDDAGPILFGLFADGSGERRFFGPNGAPVGDLRALSEWPHFSPPGDWYGRWAVLPLHGNLTPHAQRADRAVCPEDIVVLRPRQHARRA